MEEVIVPMVEEGEKGREGEEEEGEGEGEGD